MATTTEQVLQESQSQISPKIIILIISSLFLLVIIYPWIIAVTIVSFAIGFSSLEFVDKFVKSSISTGRFGTRIQNYLKDSININSDTSLPRNVITQVTADPLRDYLEESQTLEAQQKIVQNHQTPIVPHALAVTTKISTNNCNNKSSLEVLNKLSDSPKTLSVPSSRRVSEDIPILVGVTHGGLTQQKWESSSKTPSPSRSSTAASTPSPSLALSPEIAALKIDQDFKVDARVDNAFGKLCTNIMNYYISPSWAPYETRKQLRLSFKQLLTSVAEAFYRKLIRHETNSPVKLAQQKLIPLLLHYVDKILTRGLTSESPIIPKDSKRRLILKIRKFCRQIFEKYLKKDDRNCKLWMELCIAVLADGVLVNVMNLGKDKLPELLEELIKRFKASHGIKARSNLQTDLNLNDEMHHVVDPPLGNFKEQTLSASSEDPKISNECSDVCPDKVAFLLDSFLDPPFNLEKPDPIVSRWRPTIKDIVSETDLLYPLIQYMKHVGGQQSLAYLQGVLDDFPGEGDPYCRRILELEYLPGFCRSSLLLETMGLSGVEMAMEVGTDATMRRNSGHTRSASYGGPSSSFREFLKIEQGIVDGLPLTESSSQNPPVEQTGGIMLPGAGPVEPSLAFKRRPHLEMFIAKFIKSTTKSWKQYYDPLGDVYEPAKRMGIDSKSYEEWDHPEVNSRVVIEASNVDLYNSVIDIVASLIRDSPLGGPFLTGLANFLKPYLMPVFEDQLESNLREVLSVDLLVSVVNLIADVFEESPDETIYNDNDTDEIDLETAKPATAHVTSHNSHNTSQEEDSHHLHSTSCTTCDQNFKSCIQSFLITLVESFTSKMIDLEYFIKCFSKNREYIFLFFVDLLDVLISEIVEK